jgi:hypothetical protein
MDSPRASLHLTLRQDIEYRQQQPRQQSRTVFAAPMMCAFMLAEAVDCLERERRSDCRCCQRTRRRIAAHAAIITPLPPLVPALDRTTRRPSAPPALPVAPSPPQPPSPPPSSSTQRPSVEPALRPCVETETRRRLGQRVAATRATLCAICAPPRVCLNAYTKRTFFSPRLTTTARHPSKPRHKKRRHGKPIMHKAHCQAAKATHRAQRLPTAGAREARLRQR